MTESERAQKIAELESDIVELEMQLQARYSTMGKTLLDIAHNEQNETDKLFDELLRARKDLSTMKEEIRCHVCEATNLAKSRYCRACGSRLNSEARGAQNES